MAKFSDYLKNIFFLLILLQIAPPLLQNIKKQYFDVLEPKTKVGYLKIDGVLSDSSYYTKYLKKYFKNSEIKAILLKIESSGSAAGTAEAIANEITLLKKDYPKPIIMFSENIVTSGAYYIGASTDYMITLPSTLVGSIGTVLSNQFKVKDFLDQYKIHYQSIKTGAFKESTSPFVNPTPEQLAHLEEITKDSYQNFVEHVAKNRKKLTIAKADDWANGKLFTGRQALKIGLIDEIGSLSSTILHLKKVALIEGKIEWIKPAKQTKGLLSYLTGEYETPDDFTSSPLEGAISKIVKLVMHLPDQAS